jgi:pyruvate formate lyase activating enzyme
MMTVEEVMQEVVADRAFYESSGGGVTLSGGEPALSGEFAHKLLEECKRRGIHTALETCGEYPWRSLNALLPVSDLIMMDIKHMEPEKHRETTGRTNDRILANARRLAQTGKQMIIRTPIVPGVNDSEEDVRRIAMFVRELSDLRGADGVRDGKAISYELLTFHRMASGKYTSLGMEYRASAIESPTKEKMSALAQVAKACGIEARVR